MTRKLPETLAPVAIAAIGALVVGLALWATGGPDTARQERRDQERFNDLQALSYHVQCLARDTGNTLPASVEPTASCPLPEGLTDPATGQSYSYEALTDRSFRLCAQFETDQPTQMQGFDAGSGCLSSSLVP